jgi:hypothetical protein
MYSYVSPPPGARKGDPYKYMSPSNVSPSSADGDMYEYMSPYPQEHMSPPPY